MKIVNNFVWLLVTHKKAKRIFTSDLFLVYALHEDGSESLCESLDDIDRAHELGEDLGVEVGYVQLIPKQ